MFDVIGAQMTEWSRRPIGSRLNTRTGRRLSPGTSANHTSPRLAARGSCVLAIEFFVIDVVIRQVELDRQIRNSQFCVVERPPRIYGKVVAQLLGLNQTIERNIDDLGDAPTPHKGNRLRRLVPIERNSCLTLSHIMDTTTVAYRWASLTG